MSKDIVYFDLETQRTANDVGGWNKKSAMGMSIGVTYSTRTGQYKIYGERQVDDLVAQLMKADLVVGFNTLGFDYPVLMGYTILDLEHQLHSLDLMVDLEKIIGHRLKLESLAQATLGVGKTGDGLDAVKWWREGRIMDIAKYCCFDVKVTKMLHEHGATNGEVFYNDRSGRRQKVTVNWSLEP